MRGVSRDGEKGDKQRREERNKRMGGESTSEITRTTCLYAVNSSLEIVCAVVVVVIVVAAIVVVVVVATASCR